MIIVWHSTTIHSWQQQLINYIMRLNTYALTSNWIYRVINVSTRQIPIYSIPWNTLTTHTLYYHETQASFTHHSHEIIQPETTQLTWHKHKHQGQGECWRGHYWCFYPLQLALGCKTLSLVYSCTPLLCFLLLMQPYIHPTCVKKRKHY